MVLDPMDPAAPDLKKFDGLAPHREIRFYKVVDPATGVVVRGMELP